jgi:hypothetical protein
MVQKAAEIPGICESHSVVRHRDLTPDGDRGYLSAPTATPMGP